jgi:hypothetical protein
VQVVLLVLLAILLVGWLVGYVLVRIHLAYEKQKWDLE